VAAFGAFVDVGAHQDGLVHVSQLANKFVRDPKEVVKAGQIVKVKVVEVDVVRKRIALSMRMDARGASGDSRSESEGRRRDQRADEAAADGGRSSRSAIHRRPREAVRDPKPQGAMANAFAALKKL
jgi:protein Tex